MRPGGDHRLRPRPARQILAAIETQFAHESGYTIVAGLHHFTSKDKQVDWTADRSKRFGVRYLLGAHCTGIERL